MQLLTKRQVAARMGCHYATIEARVRRAEFPAATLYLGLKLVGEYLVLDGRYYLCLPQEFRRDATLRRELERDLHLQEQVRAARRPIVNLVGDYLALDGRYYLHLPQEFRRDATLRRDLDQYLRDKEQAKTDIYFASDNDHD